MAAADAAFGRPAAALAALERNVAAYRTVGNDLQIAIHGPAGASTFWPTRQKTRRNGAGWAWWPSEPSRGRQHPDTHSRAAHWLASLLRVEGRWDDLDCDLASDREPDAQPQAETAVLGLAPLAVARADWDLAQVLLAALPDGAATEPGKTLFLESQILQRLAVELSLAENAFSMARAWLEAHDRWLAWAGAVLGRAEGALLWARYHHASGNHAQARQPPSRL